MSRKVYVNASFKFILSVDEGVDISEVLNEMCNEFTPADFHQDKVSILDIETFKYEVMDSK